MKTYSPDTWRKYQAKSYWWNWKIMIGLGIVLFTLHVLGIVQFVR